MRPADTQEIHQPLILDSSWKAKRTLRMAVTINVGFSRKVGEPNGGSRGASLHLELEIDRSSLDEPERLQSQIDGLFERAREAVDRELQRDASPSSESNGSSEQPSGQESHNGCRQAPRPATPKARLTHPVD
jgi:hypothetical protein